MQKAEEAGVDVWHRKRTYRSSGSRSGATAIPKRCGPSSVPAPTVLQWQKATPLTAFRVARLPMQDDEIARGKLKVQKSGRKPEARTANAEMICVSSRVSIMADWSLARDYKVK